MVAHKPTGVPQLDSPDTVAVPAGPLQSTQKAGTGLLLGLLGLLGVESLLGLLGLLDDESLLGLLGD
jgi:hypothetical protein